MVKILSLASSVTRSHGQLSSCTKSEKNNDAILRKFSDGQTERLTKESDFIGGCWTEQSDFIGCCLTTIKHPNWKNSFKILPYKWQWIKLYSELGFETLKFSTFYKIKETNVPKYLFDLILQTRHLYNTHFLEDVPAFYCKTDVFKYSFFPYTTVKWNKPDRKYSSLNLCCLLEIFYRRLANQLPNHFTIYITLPV